MQRYFGHFSSFEEMCHEFRIPDGQIFDHQIVFACYFTESYEGSAAVLFFDKDNLNFVEGSHCSCNGLEGQWTPNMVNWGALDMKQFYYLKDKESAKLTLNAIINSKPTKDDWRRIVETYQVLVS